MTAAREESASRPTASTLMFVPPLSRTPDQGLEALDAIRRGIGGNAMKKLRDHLLCRALELPVPDEPFPHANTRAEFQAKMNR